MGKPFEIELSNIPNTLREAFYHPMDASLIKLIESLISFPILVVGSGGSLSAAHFIEKLHEDATGFIAKAMTPLRLMTSSLKPNQYAVLFITASGNNKDILNSFRLVMQQEFASVGIICASRKSKLVAEANSYPANVHSFEFANSSGRDGFVAVNSLLSTCIWMGRGYGALNNSDKSVANLLKRKIAFDTEKLDKVLERKTIVTVGGEWAWPAVLDMESKFSEVGLGNVLMSDLCNFGHGRHNWFDKKGHETAMVVLETPRLAKLSERTLAYLPKEYPSMVLRTPFSGPLAGIDLLEQVFHFTHEFGKRASIDPGRPKVPEFGSKIYHITFSPPGMPRKKSRNKVAWLERKSRVTNQPSSTLKNSLEEFLLGLKDLEFSGIVFDYDGTLCDPPDRFSQPEGDIGRSLNSLLSKHVSIGIATGRGQSVRKSLRNVIDKNNWDKILVGNYNGSFILPLSNDLPDSRKDMSNKMKNVCEYLKRDSLVNNHAEIDQSTNQITVMVKPEWKLPIRTRVLELLTNMSGIKVVESDHSIDILNSDISKMHVVEALLSSTNASNVLVVGDQGQYGGNDFEMLNLPHSLSVDKVSSSLDTCWNLSPAGLCGARATLAIISAFITGSGSFTLDIGRLEKVIK